MFTESTRSTASELDGLPDVELQETQAILNEIEKEEKETLDTQPEGEKPEKPKEDKPDDGDNGKKPEGKPDEKPSDTQHRRSPGLMPRYVHEIAVKEAQAREDGLRAEIDALKAGKVPESTDNKPTPEQSTALKEKIATTAAKIAEKHQGVSKELIQDLAESLVELGLSPAQIPQEMQEKLKAVDQFHAAQQSQAEEAAFNSSFDKTVIPLIEKEYGKLPADTLEEIRTSLAEKAYSPDFEKVPLDVIYKGLDVFRDFKRMPARSGESGRGGAERAAAESGAITDAEEFANVTEADIETMDAKTFERYTNFMEQKETGRVRQ